MNLTQTSGFYQGLGLDELECLFPVGGDTSSTTVECREDRILDFSTALSVESITPRTLPPKPLRNMLVNLFFLYVSPLCPVVDEYGFRRLHDSCSDEDFLRRFSTGLFYAIMFAAVQHLDENELATQTAFTSITDAQSTYYSIAKIAYRLELLHDREGSAELDHARICLLLSYWCPQHGAVEINSHWIDRAIYHTKAALFSTAPESSVASYDLKVIYWSCVVRNTLVSFFLRRPTRLHQLETELFTPDELLVKPRLETSHTKTAAKNVQMQLFIWTCKLCRILNNAMVSLRHQTLSSKWTARPTHQMDSSDADEQFRGSALSTQSLQLLQIQKFEQELVKLSSIYDAVRTSEGNANACADAASTENPGQLYMNRMITFSSITMLYGFYFDLVPLSKPQQWREVVWRSMLIYSEKVASLAHEVLKNVDHAHIPISMLAWILLPATLGLIQQSNGGPFSNGPSLFRLPQLLIPRYQSAESIHVLICDLGFVIGSTAKGEQKKLPAADSTKRTCRSQGPEDGSDIDVKVEALRRSMKLLDLYLAHGNPL